MRKSTINFAMYVLVEQWGSHWIDFYEIYGTWIQYGEGF